MIYTVECGQILMPGLSEGFGSEPILTNELSYVLLWPIVTLKLQNQIVTLKLQKQIETLKLQNQKE